MAAIRLMTPNRMDKISDCSLGTPKNPRNKTINPSRTPQPAKEIGMTERIVISGITNRKILKSIMIPISLAKIATENTYNTVMDNVVKISLGKFFVLKRCAP